mmetsp:Transcript_24780/g.65870  ORF Transcript_24780/g.65870 Transcript_24780/m.65870 type:complete len:220 (-) Transcript_24780:294-953(-)
MAWLEELRSTLSGCITCDPATPTTWRPRRIRWIPAYVLWPHDGHSDDAIVVDLLWSRLLHSRAAEEHSDFPALQGATLSRDNVAHVGVALEDHLPTRASYLLKVCWTTELDGGRIYSDPATRQYRHALQALGWAAHEHLDGSRLLHVVAWRHLPNLWALQRELLADDHIELVGWAVPPPLTTLAPSHHLRLAHVLHKPATFAILAFALALPFPVSILST